MQRQTWAFAALGMCTVLLLCLIYVALDRDGGDNTPVYVTSPGSWAAMELKATVDIWAGDESTTSRLSSLQRGVSDLKAASHRLAAIMEERMPVSYQPTRCGGPTGSLVVVEVGKAVISIGGTAQTCAKHDSAVLMKCLHDSFEATPEDSRLKSFVVVRHGCGAAMAGLAADRVTAAVDGGQWEPSTVAFLTAVAQRLHEEVRSVARRVLTTDQVDTIAHDDNVEFLDVGMNLGAVSLPIWKAGTVVRGFEAMASNIQLLRLTRCMNPGEDLPSFDVAHAPLGDRDAKGRVCLVMSHPSNEGAGVVGCTNGTLEDGYVRRGNVTVLTFDDAMGTPTVLTLMDKYVAALPKKLPQRPRGSNVTSPLLNHTGRISALAPETLRHFLRLKHRIMKVDVGGQEPAVLRGAAKLLSGPDAPVIIYSKSRTRIDMVAYARLMRSHGYRLYAAGNAVDQPTPATFVDDDESCDTFYKGKAGEVGVVFVRRGTEKILSGLTF